MILVPNGRSMDVEEGAGQGTQEKPIVDPSLEHCITHLHLTGLDNAVVRQQAAPVGSATVTATPSIEKADILKTWATDIIFIHGTNECWMILGLWKRALACDCRSQLSIPARTIKLATIHLTGLGIAGAGFMPLIRATAIGRYR